MIETTRQALKADGHAVPIGQLCRWFGVPRRTVYHRPTRKPPTIQDRICQPIKRRLPPKMGKPRLYRNYIIGLSDTEPPRVAHAGRGLLGGRLGERSDNLRPG
jgi:hypothetical protein